MRSYLKLFILISLFFLSCDKNKKSHKVVFDQYTGSEISIPNDSIVLIYTPINDSIYKVSSEYQKPLYIYESKRGVFESVDSKNYFVSFSFQDTLTHSNLLFPYESHTNVTLIRSKRFSVDGAEFPIYLFVESVGDEHHQKSHSGSITYYVPDIGIILMSIGDTPGSGLIRRFGRDEIGSKLIEKLRNDTTFYDGHTMKNPTVKIKDYPFPPDLID